MIALLLLIVVVVIGVVLYTRRGGAAREQQRLDDARAEAQRWYERLGGQVMNLHGDNPAAQQALTDAGERYNAAGGQLQQAKTVNQFALARESALEGLAYARAARLAMGLDPGPELPPLSSAQGAGTLTKEREVSVQGQQYRAGPQPGADTPYYYPGGRVGGRPVPSGWYSTPVWKTALGAGAGALGGLLIFDALFSPSFGDMGYGYGDSFAAGGFDGNGFDGNGFDGNGFDGNGPGGGNDFSGGGDYSGGGDFGGGDFGGGDFGGDF